MSGEGGDEEGGVNNGEWGGVNNGEGGGCRASQAEVGEQFTLDSCSLSAAMAGTTGTTGLDWTTGLEDTPFGTGELDSGEKSGLEDLMRRLFDGARNISDVEILIFFVVSSPAARGDVERTCSGEACLDGGSLDRRPMGGSVVMGRRCKVLLLIGLAEEILMS